jgi:predicted double-glycine peptidase
MRYWKIKDWNQFRMHREGYLTFEGKIAEGDRGLVKLFKQQHFTTLDQKPLRFQVKQLENAAFDDLAKSLQRLIPVIVRICTNKNTGDQHTQVLVGYSDKKVYLNDNDVYSGFDSPHWIETSRSTFNEQWTNKCLIIYPKEYRW